MPAQIGQRIGLVDDRHRIGRIDRGRALEAGKRVFLAAEPAQGHAEQIMGLAIVRRERNRLAQQLGPALELALLAMGASEQEKRVDIAGLAGKHLLVARHRRGHIAALIESDGLLKLLIHRWSRAFRKDRTRII